MPLTLSEREQLLAECEATADIIEAMQPDDQDKVFVGCHPDIGTYTEINADGSKGSTHYLPNTVVSNSSYKDSLMRETCHKELL